MRAGVRMFKGGRARVTRATPSVRATMRSVTRAGE
jgi:hypothetical protein